MRKLIAITATVAGLAFAGNGLACNNLSYVTGMNTTIKQATTAMTVAQTGDFETGLSYLHRAQRSFRSVPAPCAPLLRNSKWQYSVSLKYTEAGLYYAIAGNYGPALTSIKQASSWMNRATQSLQQFNN